MATIKPAVVKKIKARFESVCSGCRSALKVGTPLGGVVQRRCPEAPKAPRPVWYCLPCAEYYATAGTNVYGSWLDGAAMDAYYAAVTEAKDKLLAARPEWAAKFAAAKLASGELTDERRAKWEGYLRA